MSVPRFYVPSPRQTASPYGLLSVAQAQTNTAPHWQMGITYEPLCGDGDVIVNPCVSPVVSGGFTKVPTSERNIRGAQPFTVYQRIDCGLIGNYDRVEQDTAELLRRTEQTLVENAFWTGFANGTANALYPHLAANAEVTDGLEILQTAAVTVSGTALDPVQALGHLEAALAACYFGQGVIHVTPLVADLLASQTLLQRVPVGPNGQPALQTFAGNWVAVGNGYPGTSPAGAATTNAHWMYATGSVFYYRGDIRSTSRPSEAIVRNINDLVYIAERTYVVAWDCCHLAIPVNIN